MVTQHDKDQDRKIADNAAQIADNAAQIADNAEQIKRLTDYMQQIRDFHMPWASSPFKTKIRKRFVKPILKLCAAITIWMTLYKGVGFYLEKVKLHNMADRYAQVGLKLYYQEGNPDVALPFIEKALEIEKESPEYLFQRAYMQGMSATRELLNLGRPFSKAELDRAHRAYAEALYMNQIEPDRSEPYVLQGQILAALGELERAKTVLLRAVELDPANDFVYVRLAMVQLAEKNGVESAEASLDKAINLNPQSKWAWLWKGIIQFDYKNDPKAARECYDKALEIDSRFDMAHYNRGWTFARGKGADYKQARDEMIKALKINPDYKEACYAIGMFYGYEDNYAVAKVWMDKASGLDKNFLSAHKWGGIISGEMGKYEDAVKCFGAAIQLDPMNSDLYVRRAKMFVAMGDNEEALRDLKFAYELDPKAKRMLKYMGDFYLKTNDAAKAVEFYDKAIAVDGKYDDAYASKANALMKLGKKDEAIAAIDEALKVSTYKPERFEKIKNEIMRSGNVK